MSVDFTFEVDFRTQRFTDAVEGLHALATDLERIPKAIEGDLKKQLRKYLHQTVDTVAARHSRNWPNGTTSSTMSRRSGHAVRSLRRSPRVTGSTLDDMRGHIGGVPYLRIQEFGGVIRARKTKYLAIPLRAALDSRGRAIKDSPRQWNRTFVMRSKKGNLLIMRKKGRNIVPLYVLKKQVRIPPRLGLRREISNTLPGFVDMMADRMMKRMLRELS